jgi:TRAP-type mannitol/chloroaromatic compound transport system permease small subunit
VSISAATRAGTHLAADALAQHYTARTREWLKRLGAGLGLLPWALFVLIAGKTFVVPSLLELESFPKTDSPGYFLIKCGLWLMAITIIAQAVVDIFRPLPADDV